MEAAGCCLLSCNLAWDAAATAGPGSFLTAEAAVEHAAACLAAVRAPQPATAPALKVDIHPAVSLQWSNA